MKFWERVGNDPWFYGLRLAGLLLVLMLLLAWCGPATGAPVGKAEKDGVTVTLYNEPCKLDAVKNLQYRATWSEKGKTFEGCFGVQGGFVVTYWDDKTIGIIPGQAFTPVTSM